MPREELSNRQREVLQRVARGETVDQIGSVLRIRPDTVKTHKRRGYRTLGIHSRKELPRALEERGIEF